MFFTWINESKQSSRTTEKVWRPIFYHSHLKEQVEQLDKRCDQLPQDLLKETHTSKNLEMENQRAFTENQEFTEYLASSKKQWCVAAVVLIYQTLDRKLILLENVKGEEKCKNWSEKWKGALVLAIIWFHIRFH